MRILMVSKACLVGAYQKKLEAIAAHPDVELTVVVPPSWDDPAGRVELERAFTKGYRMIVDPIRFNGNYHLHHYHRLAQRLEQCQPHLLHMDEEPYNLATWMAFRQAKARDIKRLFFSWQNIYRSYPIPFRWMEQQVLRMADYAIAGNQASARIWRRKGYNSPIAIIPQFGVDPALYTPATPDEGRSFTIGIGGRRLVAEKGIDLLLHALDDVPGTWRLHIAGEGPSQPELQKLARQLGLDDRVFFDGVISSERMPAYLRQLDVLVLPSRTTPHWKEQFGRILIEAMACSVPVIGSDSGEIPNVIGNAGRIFKEDDIEALREELLLLMRNPEYRRQLGTAGRQRVLEKFTQERIAAQTVSVYRTLMNKEVERELRSN